MDRCTSGVIARCPAHVSLITLSVSILAGCGTLPDGSRWGEGALYPIDLDRVSRAAHDAFFNLNTLVPLAGAAVFAIDDFDERASDWAVKHTPIYNSPEDAKQAGDDIKGALGIEAFCTSLPTASGDLSGQWLVAKSRGVAVEVLAVGATEGVTTGLKNATGRTRPDESNDKSFPSGHASSAFSYATLANRNIDSIDMPPGLRTPIKVGNLLLASGVAWARVEGQKHYPSDVLAGAALGYFLTAFIHDAFMNLPEDGSVDFAVYPVDDGAGVMLSFRF